MDVKLELMVMSGPDDGLVHSVKGNFVHDERVDLWRCRFTIGRRDVCDVCIPFDTLVSRLHASVEITPDGQIWVKDEESRNGTFVGRERLALVPAELRQGDMFKVGKTLLRLEQVHIAEEV
ncbi:MAG: FHA domain-containing protein [Chloroflexi bacterium]|nr:FHA domain-containing protein [Chloroflexota bacterium]